MSSWPDLFAVRNLPSKAETEKKRRDNRAKYRKMARDYLQEGRHKEARECMQVCWPLTKFPFCLLFSKLTVSMKQTRTKQNTNIF